MFAGSEQDAYDMLFEKNVKCRAIAIKITPELKEFVVGNTREIPLKFIYQSSKDTVEKSTINIKKRSGIFIEFE